MSEPAPNEKCDCDESGHNYIEVNDNHVGCSVNTYRWKCSKCRRLYKHKEA